MDNSDNPDDTYPYTYTLKLNSGAVSSAYEGSAIFVGAANGSAFAIRSPD